MPAQIACLQIEVITGRNDDRNGRSFLQDAARQFHTRHTGKADIRDENIELAASPGVQRVFRGGQRDDFS